MIVFAFRFADFQERHESGIQMLKYFGEIDDSTKKLC